MESLEIKNEFSKEETTGRRMRWFRYHIALYFLCILLLTALKFLINIADTWFVFLLLVWGGVLAIHVAYVMRLFDAFHSD